MTPEQWQALYEIFSRILDAPPEDRDSLLSDLCPQPEMQAEIKKLLERDQEAEEAGFLTPTGPADHSVEPLTFRSNRFQILEKIGQGGMGVVYRAFDLERQQIVALKTIQNQSPANLYRFKREFRALADVRHDNLVSLYELIADQEQWYFTMELVVGSSFLDYIYGIEQQPPFHAQSAQQSSDSTVVDTVPQHQHGSRQSSEPNEQRLRQAMAQLTQGLMALHQADRLHRDVKPSNILVTSEGRVVILDFGLAAELDPSGIHRTTAQHVLGTVAYMPPEQAAQKPVQPSGDWYSVGVILYEILAGQLPFEGPPLQVLQDKQVKIPSPPSTIRPVHSPDLEQLCLELLDPEPSNRPNGTEILNRLGALGTGTTKPVAPPQSTLIGRAQELSLLGQAAQAVQNGSTVAVSVSGPSGIGKTALVQAFLEDLETTKNAVVLRGRCYERESVPFKAMDSLVDSLSHYLATLKPLEARSLLPRDIAALTRVFVVLSRAPFMAGIPIRSHSDPAPQEVRRRGALALRELIARLGESRLLVLAIDDLQWGDVDSAWILRELLRPPDPPVLLLILSYRSTDVARSECLQALMEGESGLQEIVDHRQITVPPLSLDEASQLAMDLLPEDAIHPTHAIATESGGNPFFVMELARSVSALSEASGDPMPLSLDQVLWQRAQQLPEPSRDLLELLAVTGHPITESVAKEALSPRDFGEQDLAVLRNDRWIRMHGTGSDLKLETYHDRIRETLVERLPLDRAQGIHLGVAHAMEKGGAQEGDQLAFHYLQAGQTEAASAYLAQAAAQSVLSLAFDHAASLYQQLLAIPTLDPQWKRQLHRLRADALLDAGRSAEAAGEYLLAAQGAPEAENLELYRLAATHFLFTGHMAQGQEALKVVLKALGARLTRSPLRSILAILWYRARLWWQGWRLQERKEEGCSPQELLEVDTWSALSMAMIQSDILWAQELHYKHSLLAVKLGEPTRFHRALVLEVIYSSLHEPPRSNRSARLLDRVFAMAEKLGEPLYRGRAFLTAAIVGCAKGRWSSAIENADRASQIFREECRGAGWELHLVNTYGLVARYFSGRLVDIQKRYQDAILDAQERGDLYVLRDLRVNIGYFIHLMNDQPEKGLQQLQEVLAEWPEDWASTQREFAAICEVFIQLYRGEIEAAWAIVSDPDSTVARSYLIRLRQYQGTWRWMQATTALAMASNASGHQRNKLIQAAQRYSRKSPKFPEYLEAYQSWVGTEIALLQNNQDLAREHLRTAEARFRNADMHFQMHISRYRQGLLTGGEGGRARVEEAEQWLRDGGVKNPYRMLRLFLPVDLPKPDL